MAVLRFALSRRHLNVVNPPILIFEDYFVVRSKACRTPRLRTALPEVFGPYDPQGHRTGVLHGSGLWRLKYSLSPLDGFCAGLFLGRGYFNRSGVEIDHDAGAFTRQRQGLARRQGLLHNQHLVITNLFGLVAPWHRSEEHTS